MQSLNDIMRVLRRRDTAIVIGVSSQRLHEKKKKEKTRRENVSRVPDVKFLLWEYAGAFYQVDTRCVTLHTSDESRESPQSRALFFAI